MQPVTMTPTEAPGSVRAAFWLALTSIAVGLLHSFLNLVYVHQGDAGRALSEAGADTESLRRSTVAVAAVLLVVQLVIIFRMRAGARWARTVLTLLLLIQLVSYWVIVGRPSDQVDTGTLAGKMDLVANSAAASLGVLTLVFLHTRASRSWYRKH